MTAISGVQNPFPGLRAFEPEESTRYFGRDEEIGEALDRLLERRLLAVVGVSGSGKSSLVKAGVVPALLMGLAGDPATHWRVAAMRPGDGPLRELSRCLGFGGAALAERTYGLIEAVETNLLRGENLLLVVDQFEEIFPFRDRKLKGGGGSEADLFVSYLLRAARDLSGRVYVLLSMRSDYLGDCAKFSGLPEALNDGQYLVPRMTRQQLQEAIEGPFEAAGVQIHPALVQDLLNRCDDEPDNLPLLQHLLRRMFEEWERRGATGPVTIELTRTVGSLTGALDQDAEAVYRALSPEQKRLAQMVFRRITESRRLTDHPEEDLPIRRPQTIETLARMARVEQHVLAELVHRFAERGLLVVRSTDEGDKVDLPHECLCLRWATLNKWIRTEAAEAKTLRFLLDVSERRTHLTGLALTQALDLTNDEQLNWCERYLTAGQINEVREWVKESQYIVDEQARLARRQLSRTRWAAVVFGILALAALGFAFVAVAMKGRAQTAESQSQKALEKAQNALTEVIRRLMYQLGSGDTSQVLAAMELLTTVHHIGSAELLKRIPNDRFLSPMFLLPFVTGLDDAVRSGLGGTWALPLRASLGVRISQARGIAPPPAPDADQKLNKRILVPGARFRMGSARGEGQPDERPEHSVELTSFLMQQNEVTDREYHRFDPKYRLNEQPRSAVRVNWFESFAYAVWLGGDLPTEAQWEYAARAHGRRKYSWGNDEPLPADFGLFGDVLPRRHQGPMGIADLSGGVWEWCHDWYGPYSDDEKKDPKGPPEGIARVLRGGSLYDRPEYLRAAYRFNYHPAISSDNAGFRVVWSALGKLRTP
ncbi:MAG: SUMF1/EgtB/PvdO family nonheme iron enzyme [Acidobacteriota bacterium]